MHLEPSGPQNAAIDCLRVVRLTDDNHAFVILSAVERLEEAVDYLPLVIVVAVVGDVAVAAADLNDYRLVKYGKQPFKPLYPVHTFQKHVVSRRFLEDSVRERGDGKLVFVTHHAPSMRSVEDRFRKDVLSAAYASNLEHMVADVRGPDLWVHGHLHNSSDYVVGSTRVVCNPRGYSRESSSRVFDRRLLIDV